MPVYANSNVCSSSPLLSVPKKAVLRDCRVSILHKSIAGRYRPVRVTDGPIMARYIFIMNAGWVWLLLCSFIYILINIFSFNFIYKQRVLREEVKEMLKWNVDRSSPSNKIRDLMEWSKDIMKDIAYQRKILSNLIAIILTKGW